jgi:hypothetical protein
VADQLLYEYLQLITEQEINNREGEKKMCCTSLLQIAIQERLGMFAARSMRNQFIPEGVRCLKLAGSLAESEKCIDLEFTDPNEGSS